MHRSRGVVEIVEDDTLPKITVTWEGTNITGYSFTLQVDQNGTVLEKSGTIDDAANGVFSFQFADGDLVPGLHRARIVSDDGSSGIQTFRGLEIKVPGKWVAP